MSRVKELWWEEINTGQEDLEYQEYLYQQQQQIEENNNEKQEENGNVDKL